MAPADGLASALDRSRASSWDRCPSARWDACSTSDSGSAFPRPTVVRLHEASSGNPFLALEIGRTIRSRGTSLSPGEPFPVPPETGALVRDHLSALSRDGRRSLLIVTMSVEPTLELVERVIGSGAVTAVDEAVALGVLESDGRRLRPAHPLYASIARIDAPPGERRALHAALARIADDPVERAIHLAASAGGNAPGAADALAAAARIARGRGAPSVAADLLERAAELDGIAPRRVEFLLEAADAAMAAGDADRAEDGLRAALGVVPPGAQRARTLLALGDIVYVQRPHEALALLVDALDHTDGDPVLEALVHAHVTGMADMDPSRGYRSALAAVELLAGHEERAEPDQVACALLDRAFHWLLSGERLALEDIDNGLALMRGTGNSFVSRRAQEVAERCQFHLGRLREAIALDEAEGRRLTETGQVGLLPPCCRRSRSCSSWPVTGPPHGAPPGSARTSSIRASWRGSIARTWLRPGSSRTTATWTRPGRWRATPRSSRKRPATAGRPRSSGRCSGSSSCRSLIRARHWTTCSRRATTPTRWRSSCRPSSASSATWSRRRS